MKNISRRTAIKTVLAGSAAMAVSGMEAAAPAKKKKVEKPEPLKGNIRHSVSKWCFGSYPLDEFCEICKNIGIESIELLDPNKELYKAFNISAIPYVLVINDKKVVWTHSGYMPGNEVLVVDKALETIGKK